MTAMDDPEAAIENLRRIVGTGKYRLDVSTALRWDDQTMRTVGTVRIYEPGQTRGGNFKWVKVDPFLTPAEGQSMKDVMEMILGWAP